MRFIHMTNAEVKVRQIIYCLTNQQVARGIVQTGFTSSWPWISGYTPSISHQIHSLQCNADNVWNINYPTAIKINIRFHIPLA